MNKPSRPIETVAIPAAQAIRESEELLAKMLKSKHRPQAIATSKPPTISEWKSGKQPQTLGQAKTLLDTIRAFGDQPSGATVGRHHHAGANHPTPRPAPKAAAPKKATPTEPQKPATPAIDGFRDLKSTEVVAYRRANKKALAAEAEAVAKWKVALAAFRKDQRKRNANTGRF